MLLSLVGQIEGESQEKFPCLIGDFLFQGKRASRRYYGHLGLNGMCLGVDQQHYDL